MQRQLGGEGCGSWLLSKAGDPKGLAATCLPFCLGKGGAMCSGQVWVEERSRLHLHLEKERKGEGRYGGFFLPPDSLGVTSQRGLHTVGLKIRVCRRLIYGLITELIHVERWILREPGNLGVVEEVSMGLNIGCSWFHPLLLQQCLTR